MKVNKADLHRIADFARKNYISDDPTELSGDNEAFLAQCWVKACQTVLKLGNIELPKRIFVEPLDEIQSTDKPTTNK